MKKYVITSDRYLSLLKGHAHFFNKNWSKDEEVVILCYNKPNFDLPDNFVVHSLGRQKDYGKYWTNALIPYFKNTKEKYFMLLLDDLFLREPIDLKTLVEMEDMIIKQRADKACLVKLVAKSDYEGVISDNIVQINKLTITAIEHRTTLQPSIWNKNYFLEYLKPNYTAWDFELRNRDKARVEKSIVIGPKNKRVYAHFNLIRSKRVYHKTFLGVVLDDEDNRVITNLIEEW